MAESLFVVFKVQGPVRSPARKTPKGLCKTIPLPPPAEKLQGQEGSRNAQSWGNTSCRPPGRGNIPEPEMTGPGAVRKQSEHGKK